LDGTNPVPGTSRSSDDLASAAIIDPVQVRTYYPQRKNGYVEEIEFGT
jgi:hypothetical protein